MPRPKEILPIRDDNPKEETLEVLSTPVEGESTTVVNENPGAETQHRAQRFVDLVKHGTEPKEAAKAVGASLQSITSRDGFGQAVGKLIGDFELDSEITRRMVEAGLNKLFIESVSSKDPAHRKIALDTAKQIGQNKSFSPSDGVVIDLGGLADIIKGATIPGLPPFKEPPE